MVQSVAKQGREVAGYMLLSAVIEQRCWCRQQTSLLLESKICTQALGYMPCTTVSNLVSYSILNLFSNSSELHC